MYSPMRGCPDHQCSVPVPRALSIELSDATDFATLPRGDREDVAAEPIPQAVADPERSGRIRGTPLPGARTLADVIEAPLPEDRARAAKPLTPPVPLPEPALVSRQMPVSASPAMTTLRRRGPRGMSLPERRMTSIQSEERLSERRLPDPQTNSGAWTPAPALLLPRRLELPEQAASASGSEEARAPALDMGARASPVAAVLPKEAGISMFAAHVTESTPMLPEDRQPAAVTPPPPEPELESSPVPAPVRRVARLSGPRERGDAMPAAGGASAARTVRAYQSKVRAHLAANKPHGLYGSGRAVVAFSLSPGGGVRSAEIVQSSGDATMDKSVLRSVARSEPFPKPPAGLTPAQLHFVVPFEFR